KLDCHFGAAVGVVPGGDDAVVALRDGFDDGQAETTAPGGARGVGTSESVEGDRQEGGVEARPVVADVNDDSARFTTVGMDGERGGVGCGGVGDEVVKDSIEVAGVAADL